MRLSTSSFGLAYCFINDAVEAKKGVPLNLNFFESFFYEANPKSIKHSIFCPYFVIIFYGFISLWINPI
jgi:hypothetical protein